MIVHATFAKPDFDRPLDVPKALADVPEGATVRGMFFQMVAERVMRETGRTLRAEVPQGFSHGSMREFMQLLVDAAAALHPNVSTREGLRRLGHSLYDDFYSTMVGKAIFSVAGRSFTRLADLAPRAYDVSYSPCNLRTHIAGPTSVRVSMRPNFVFPDCYQVGAWEGAARFCSLEPTILVTPYTTPGHIDFEISYRGI